MDTAIFRYPFAVVFVAIGFATGRRAVAAQPADPFPTQILVTSPPRSSFSPMAVPKSTPALPPAV